MYVCICICIYTCIFVKRIGSFGTSLGSTTVPKNVYVQQAQEGAEVAPNSTWAKILDHSKHSRHEFVLEFYVSAMFSLAWTDTKWITACPRSAGSDV